LKVVQFPDLSVGCFAHCVFNGSRFDDDMFHFVSPFGVAELDESDFCSAATNQRKLKVIQIAQLNLGCFSNRAFENRGFHFGVFHGFPSLFDDSDECDFCSAAADIGELKGIEFLQLSVGRISYGFFDYRDFDVRQFHLQNPPYG